MNEWVEVTLGELCERGGGHIRTGPFGSQLHRHDYIEGDGGVPVVMPKDMRDGRIDTSSIARVGPAVIERLADHLLEPGDLVFARRGDVGRTAWVTEEDVPVLCGTGSMRIHPGASDEVSAEFLRYYVQSREAVGYLQGRAVGATMPNLNAGIVAEMPVPLPPMDRQRFAAETLGAIDDLIENNRRRVEVLEEMARTIYREWFVHFRYPGHEDVPLVDSDLGPIPSGWQAVTLGDLVELRYGKALKKEDRAGGTVAVVGSGGIVGWHDESLVPGPGVILGRKGNVGSVTWVDGGSWPIDTTYYVETDLPSRFIDQLLRHVDFDNSHAAVPGLNRDAAYAKTACLPPQILLDGFAATADDLGATARSLSAAADRLASLRDLLLPKLVTGQIDVSDLDLDALIEGARVGRDLDAPAGAQPSATVEVG